jgi:SAM-dependent methyltransferase
MMGSEPKSGLQAVSNPRSMAGIGTHELAFAELGEHLDKISNVLDLAAGEGAFSKRLKDAGLNVTAVDSTTDHWKLADIPVEICDLDSEFADDLVGAKGKFDAVIAIEIIEHLENPFQFVRECRKLLKPGGLLLLTTPNVDSVFSRVLFFYTGRLHSFGEGETIRTAHITPIFRWKLDMILDEAGFEVISTRFVPLIHTETANLKIRIVTRLSRLIGPFLKGDKGAEGRIVLAKLK